MREIREGSIVRPGYFIRNWRRLRIPYLVVNTERQMFVYLFTGGDALVEKKLAEEYFGDVVIRHEVVPHGPPGSGFRSVTSVPQASFFRAPRPKLRMRVLKRDEYRCRICGRRPTDYTDVELDVHHIRPWSTGGLTEEWNLIALCHTCHKGLDPHEEYGLFELLMQRLPDADAGIRNLLAGMLRYQAVIKRAYEAEVATRETAKSSPRTTTEVDPIVKTILFRR